MVSDLKIFTYQVIMKISCLNNIFKKAIILLLLPTKFKSLIFKNR